MSFKFTTTCTFMQDNGHACSDANGYLTVQGAIVFSYFALLTWVFTFCKFHSVCAL
jgi:hypothetical protein